MITADTAALAGILADELLCTHSSGNTDTKERYLDVIRSGYVVHRSSEVDDLKFRQHGNVGMLMGRARIEAVVAGAERLLDNRFFASRVKDDDAWRLLAWVSIPAPQQKSPLPDSHA